MNILFFVHPSIGLFVAGLMFFFIRARLLRLLLIIAAPLLAVSQIFALKNPVEPLILHYLGYDLLPLQNHPYSLLFASAFTIVTLIGGVFAHAAKARSQEVGLGYLSTAGGIGILFAGDFISFFLFWELLAVSSMFLIWYGHRPASQGAGLRYGLAHLLSGMLLLGGMTILAGITDTILFTPFHFRADQWLWTSFAYSQNISASSIAIWMMLAGILISAGAPPFSALIADSYPESSPAGMVFLSSFSTKAAIFTLMTFFSGAKIFLYLGLFMGAHGIFMAMLENDCRRLLAFILLTQLGMMLIAIGIGSEQALNGTAILAINHIFYNSLLVIVAGGIMLRTKGETRFIHLGGQAEIMPFFCCCAFVGILSMAGFPGTGGYLGKAIISKAAAVSGNTWLWYGVIFIASAIAICGSLRFFWFIFYHKPRLEKPHARLSVSASLAIIVASIFTLLPGLFPYHYLIPLLPGDFSFHFLDTHSILAQLQLILFSSIAFFFFLPLLRPTDNITLDMDWIYRKLLVKIVFILEKILELAYVILMYVNRRFSHIFTAFVIRLTGPGGLFAETKTLANTTLIVAVLLAGYLLLYYD